jgi:hypothetical protein
MKRVLALNNLGQLTYCTCPIELRGKGRCNHLYHKQEGEKTSEFINKMNDVIRSGKFGKHDIEMKFSKNSPFKITYLGTPNNIDNILFKKRNGAYQLTEYSKYIILSQGVKFFAKQICDLDIEQKFHRESTTDIVDPEVYYNKLKEYQQNKNQFDLMIKEWAKENRNKFEYELYIPSIQKYAKDFQFNSLNLSLEDAVQGYKYCNTMLKKLNRKKLLLAKKLVIKPEFKQDYYDTCKNFREIVGFPTESEIKSKITDKISQRKTRLCLNRKPFNNMDSAKEYVQSYIEHLIQI